MRNRILKLFLVPGLSLFIAVGTILISTSAFAALSRQPYLQSVSDTRVVLRWRTTASASSRVSFGPTLGNLNTNVDVAGNRTEHEVVISGLTPNTQYFYSVGSVAGTIEAGNDADHYFRTAPTVGSNQKLRIWAIGDPGTGDANQRNVRDAYFNLDAIETDIVLTLGDNAYNDGTDSEYTNNFFNVYNDLFRQTPVWAARGNHERNLSVHETAFTHPTQAESGGFSSGSELYYSFDYGNVHFVCLDSFTSDNLNGNAMYTWLENDLSSTTQKWIVAFWHHPPYSRSSSHDSNTEVGQRVTRERANPILERYGVDLQLAGHNHFYSRTFLINSHYGSSTTYTAATHAVDGGNGRADGDGEYQKGSDPEGAVYVLAGSSGKQNYTPRNHPANFVVIEELASMVIDVEGDRMDVRMLRSNGSIPDYFTITKTPAVNQAPEVSAGGNQTIVLPASAVLNGTVTDDGLPSGVNVTSSWSQVSGPGVATFANATIASTTASFSTAGTYVLRLSASDTLLSASDEITVTVTPPPPVNQAPVVSAGADQSVELPNDADLAGSVTDDGLPSGTTTATWSEVSGPGVVTFGDASSASTTASFSAIGSYVLRLTGSDGPLSSVDDLTVTVAHAPGTEVILEENASGGDNVEVKQGQLGAQSFSHASADYNVTRVTLYLSRKGGAVAPNGPLQFSIGSGINSGTIAGSEMDIDASGVTDTSEGTTFVAIDVSFASPVSLSGDTTYYMNFDTDASNGEAYFLEFSTGNTYPRGTYYKGGFDDGRDIRFQIHGFVGAPIPDTEAPTTPGNLRVSAFTATTVTLDWAAATDNVTVTGYRVTRDGAVVGNTATLSFADGGLTQATTYAYEVVALDSAGNESAPAAVTATTAATPDTEAPTPVTNLTASSVTSSGATLNWDAATDDVAVTNYRVTRDGVTIADTTTLTFIDRNLSPQTTYTYTVAAEDAAGNRSAVAIVPVTTAERRGGGGGGGGSLGGLSLFVLFTFLILFRRPPGRRRWSMPRKKLERSILGKAKVRP